MGHPGDKVTLRTDRKGMVRRCCGETVAVAAKLYGDGATLAEVARVFGVAQSTARRWLVDAGVPRRPKGRPRKVLSLACDAGPAVELNIDRGFIVEMVKMDAKLVAGCLLLVHGWGVSDLAEDAVIYGQLHAARIAGLDWRDVEQGVFEFQAELGVLVDEANRRCAAARRVA